MDWTSPLAALGTGALLGGIFSALRLPVPAPTTIGGILGIIGIAIGYVIVGRFIH